MLDTKRDFDHIPKEGRGRRRPGVNNYRSYSPLSLSLNNLQSSFRPLPYYSRYRSTSLYLTCETNDTQILLYKILPLFSNNVSLPLQFWRWHIMLLVRPYHFFRNIMRLKTYGVNIVHLMQENSQIISIQTLNSN